MQKIIAANKQITICELIKRYTYGVYELIEQYLKLATAPIICEVVKCHS